MVAVGELMLDGSDDGEVLYIQCMGMGRAGQRMGAGARSRGRAGGLCTSQAMSDTVRMAMGM